MALQTKVGQFAASTVSGNQAISDVGFQGKAVIFWGDRIATTGFSANVQFFFGCATAATERWCFATADDDGVVNGDTGRTSTDTACLRMISDATTPTIDGVADFVSWDATGFTINWSDPPSIAVLINYWVIGGSDIASAKAGDFTLATSGATQSSTDPGFQPDALLMAHIGLATHTDSTSSYISIGAASSNTDQACALSRANDAATTRMKWQKSGRITLGTATGGTADHEASLQTFDATGWTLNVNDLPSAARMHGYLALKGARWKVGVDTQLTTTGAKDTALAFDPKTVMVVGVNAASNSAIDTTDNRYSVGAGDGTTQGGNWFQDVGGGTTDANRYVSNTNALTHATSTATIDAQASLSVGTQKFTLNWTTADATAREFIYLAMGSSPISTDLLMPMMQGRGGF